MFSSQREGFLDESVLLRGILTANPLYDSEFQIVEPKDLYLSLTRINGMPCRSDDELGCEGRWDVGDTSGILI